MKTYTIKRTDGSVLAAGEAKSIKAFIEGLARDNVDLSHMNARNLDLSSVYFPPGTVARGAVWDEANLNEATMIGMDLSGCSFTSTKLNMANMREAKISGSKFTGAYADGLILSDVTAKYCEFIDTTMVSTWGRGGTFDGSTFDRCNLSYVKWPGSSHIGTIYNRCDFSGAFFKSSKPTKPTKKTAKNYWAGACIENCTFDEKTAFPENAEAMASDRGRQNVIRGAGKVLGAIAMTEIASRLEHVLMDNHTAMANSAAIYYGATVAAIIVIPVLHEYMGEYVRDGVEGVAATIKDCLLAIQNEGGKLRDLVMLTGRAKSLKPLKFALKSVIESEEHKYASWWHSFKSFTFVNKEVLVCDQRTLALATDKILTFLKDEYAPLEHITFVNPSLPKDSSAAISLSASGVLKGVFTRENDVTVIEYNRATRHFHMKVSVPGKASVVKKGKLDSAAPVEANIMQYFLHGFENSLNAAFHDAVVADGDQKPVINNQANHGESQSKPEDLAKNEPAAAPAM